MTPNGMAGAAPEAAPSAASAAAADPMAEVRRALRYVTRGELLRRAGTAEWCARDAEERADREEARRAERKRLTGRASTGGRKATPDQLRGYAMRNRALERLFRALAETPDVPPTLD